MKFSIVTISYNAQSTIRATIESVLSQKYDDVEYIIVDGNSYDKTVDIINEYIDHVSKFVSEPDKGIYDAMNKGIGLASGDFLLFMNAGDTFSDESVLEDVAKLVDVDSDVVYGDNWLVYDNNVLYHKAGFFSSRDINMPFNHQSAFVKVKLAKENPFVLKYKIAGDYAFFYNLFKLGKKFQHISIPIANYAMDGMSQQHVIKTFNEVCDIQGRKRNATYWLDYLKLITKTKLRPLLPESLVTFYRKKTI